MMTLSAFMIFLALLVAAIAFFHSTQGFFSGIISAILAAFSAVLALSYHEWIVESFLGGLMADYAHGIVLPVLFATIYLILRTIFDKVIPSGARVPGALDKVGAIAMGAVAGIFAAGILAISAQSLPFNPAILGYSRVETSEGSAMIPQGGLKRRMSQPLYDSLTLGKPLHLAAPDQRQMMFLPADDIVVETTRKLSDSGALAVSSDSTLSRMHPDWLLELFGQRVGIQTAGKRTAINKPDKQTQDVYALGGTREPTHADAGPYILDKKLPQRLADFASVSLNTGINEKEKFGEKLGSGEIPVVIRVYFGNKAKDTRDSLIRLSTSSIRLVTRKMGDSGELEWTDYFPVATLEATKDVYVHRPDDFIFIDDSTAGEQTLPNGKTENVTDKAADFIFVVKSQGFLEGNTRVTPDKLKEAAGTKISEGTFLEVKRLARVELGGEAIRPFTALPMKMAVAVMRKDLVKTPEVVAGEVAATPEELAKKLIGTWDMLGGEGPMTGTFSEGRYTVVVQDNQYKEVGRMTGVWKPLGLKDNGLSIQVNGTSSSGKLINDKAIVTFSGDTSGEYTDNDGKGQKLTMSRKADAATPAPAAPGTPPAMPAPTTPSPASPPPGVPAVPPENSLKVSAPGDFNPKFFAAIGVPPGSVGDVAIPGGTVTIEGTNIKGLKLDNAEEDKLKGTGEPLNRLGKADGTGIWQVETAAGPDGWAFKDKLSQINVVDAQGNRYKLVGFWALADGKLFARFTTDGAPDLTGFIPPPTAPTKVWLAFQVPENVTPTKIMSGQAPLAGQ